jgi:type IV pilus assembly protein PilE
MKDKIFKMRSGRGFTLLEVLGVATMVSILVLISIPAYGKYAAQAMRANMQTEMYRLQQQEERYFSQKKAYFAGVSNVKGKWAAHYQLCAVGLDERSDRPSSCDAAGNGDYSYYAILAIPTSQRQKSDGCGMLLLGGAGEKLVKDESDSKWKVSGNCW